MNFSGPLVDKNRFGQLLTLMKWSKKSAVNWAQLGTFSFAWKFASFPLAQPAFHQAVPPPRPLTGARMTQSAFQPVQTRLIPFLRVKPSPLGSTIISVMIVRVFSIFSCLHRKNNSVIFITKLFSGEKKLTRTVVAQITASLEGLLLSFTFIPIMTLLS